MFNAKEYNKKYYQEHKAHYQAYQKEYGRIHREVANQRSYRYYARLKAEVISHYSNGSNRCLRCNYADIRALTIDHLDGKGTQHKIRIGRHGSDFYQWLRQNNYPDGYQVLCMNCQKIKQREKGEYRKAGELNEL